MIVPTDGEAEEVDYCDYTPAERAKSLLEEADLSADDNYERALFYIATEIAFLADELKTLNFNLERVIGAHSTMTRDGAPSWTQFIRVKNVQP